MCCLRYDIVCIEKDEEKVKGLQEGHGDWSRSMVPVSLSYVLSIGLHLQMTPALATHTADLVAHQLWPASTSDVYPVGRATMGS